MECVGVLRRTYRWHPTIRSWFNGSSSNLAHHGTPVRQKLDHLDTFGCSAWMLCLDALLSSSPLQHRICSSWNRSWICVAHWMLYLSALRHQYPGISALTIHSVHGWLRAGRPTVPWPIFEGDVFFWGARFDKTLWEYLDMICVFS